jgi:transcriptional regulator with XRE-family HTH domain
MHKEVIVLFTDKQFQERLSELRLQRDVSAREMSQSIGQSDNYICNIENRHNLPSMSVFFYICDYLKVTPQEFFDLESHDPTRLTEITEKLKRLTPDQLALISKLIDQMK